MHRRILMLLCLLMLGATALAQDEVPTTAPGESLAPLVVWWPDLLVSDLDALDLLDSQTSAFIVNEGNVQVEFRTKRATDEIGGLMPSLRTASGVAPGALPDLTLVRRKDLLAAHNDGLIQLLAGVASVDAAIIGDLDAALQLGQIDGELYGVPYLLTVQHSVYSPASGVDYGSWRFEDVLARDETFIFPAGRTTGVNEIFLVQYLSAGGVFRDGSLILNEPALNSTLTFYEQAREQGLIDVSVLDYTRPSDYLPSLTEGLVDVGIVTSGTYLRLQAEDSSLLPALIPTQSGQATTVLDGWVWVLVASNPDRQALAMRYLNWMMNADRQGEYAQTIQMLPSQRPALQRWLPSEDYTALVSTLLDNAVLPLTEGDGGTLARAMQTALAAVITGEQTADEATQSVVDQVTQ